MFVDYGIDEGDDPFSEETWKKANPNYGRAFYERAIHL
jgi:phage terminase large subunit-like protein